MIGSILIDIKTELGDFFKFTTIESVGPLITRMVGMAVAIAALFLLIYLIMAGMEWLTSGGEKTSVANAKAKISNAFIGLFIVLAAWAIFALVKYMFGIPGATPGGAGKPGGQPGQPEEPPAPAYLCPGSNRPPSSDTCVGWWECKDRYGEGWYCEIFKEKRGDASWGWCCPPK